MYSEGYLMASPDTKIGKCTQKKLSPNIKLWLFTWHLFWKSIRPICSGGRLGPWGAQGGEAPRKMCNFMHSKGYLMASPDTKIGNFKHIDVTKRSSAVI